MSHLTYPPSEDYMNSKVKTMTKDLNVRPPALLTYEVYEVSPNIALNFNFSRIEITISSKAEFSLKFKSLNVRLEVGDTATAMFKKPQVGDDKSRRTRSTMLHRRTDST